MRVALPPSQGFSPPAALPIVDTSQLLAWMKTVACHISKQGMVQPSSPQPLQPLPTVNPEGIQDGEKQDPGLRQLRCISKE